MSLAQIVGDAFRVARNTLPLTAYPYDGEHIACPLCGHDTAKPVSGIDRRLKFLPTVVCEGCGLLYTNPMPTEAELDWYYRRLYRLDYQLVLSPSKRHRRKRQREAARRIAKLDDLLAPGISSLDFGAGSGELVEAMCDLGFDAYGFEPGESYSSDARLRLGDRIETKLWKDIVHVETFDLVTCYHVLEHLRDPLAALRAAAGWLKPNGLLHVEVPDTMAILDRKGFGGLHFAHVIGFNRHNLELLGAMAGFSALRVVAPTSIVFRKSPERTDTKPLLNEGAAASKRILFQSLARNYMRHHFGKLQTPRLRLG